MVLLGAGALLICCAGPLLAAGGLITFAWLADVLHPYRASLVTASLVLFAAGWYASRWGRPACCEPGSSSRVGLRRLALVLWALGALVLVAALVSTARTIAQ